MLSCQAGMCLNCTMTTSSSPFLGSIKGQTVSCSLGHLVNATVMSCHRSCGWLPSDSRGTATARFSVVLIRAGIRWGKCLHLTLSPPFSDSVKMRTDYLKKKKKKKSGIVVLVLAEDLGD